MSQGIPLAWSSGACGKWQIRYLLTCAGIFSHTRGKQCIGGNLKMCWVALFWFYCMVDWFYVHLIILGRNAYIS